MRDMRGRMRNSSPMISSQRSLTSLLFEQVGGLAKTVVDPDGYRFDLGGHRVLTKSKEVKHLWLTILGDEFLMRPRMSRIYWHGKFLDYPLRGTDVIRKLGPIELTRSLMSYLWAAVKPKGRED